MTLFKLDKAGAECYFGPEKGDELAMNRWLGLSPTPGYLLLVLELSPILLIYLLFIFLANVHALSTGPLSLFIQRPIGSCLIFLTFSIIAFKRIRQFQSPTIGPNPVMVTKLVAILLLLSAIGNLLQSILISVLTRFGDLQAYAHVAMALDVVGVLISAATVLAIWSLYWALKTSPIEEIGAFASILLVGGVAVLWAQAASIPGIGYLTNMVLVAFTSAEFALDLYAMVLLCGLFMGKQLRSLTIAWRRFVCFAAGAVGVTLLQDRLSYEVSKSQASLTATADILRLSALDSILWLLVATFWALAVLNIHAGALTEGGAAEAAERAAQS